MAKRIITLLGKPVQDEDYKAAEAITPGHLVDLDGSGDVIKAASAGADVPRAFALEREEMGFGIDDAYAIGDTVKRGTFTRGQRVLALIASGENIALDQHLESAGNGTLRALAAGTALARALEAVNNSAGPADARLRTEII